MKTKGMTTLHLRKTTNRSPLRLGVLLTALAWFAVSPSARAVGQLFTVNSLGDGDDANLNDGRCETVTAGECTLRAAIEQINHDNNSADSIGFNIPTAQPWTIGLTKALPD